MSMTNLVDLEEQDKRDILRMLTLLLPVEIIGTHWMYRDKGDSDARFYMKEDVDKLLFFIMEKLD